MITFELENFIFRDTLYEKTKKRDGYFAHFYLKCCQKEVYISMSQEEVKMQKQYFEMTPLSQQGVSIESITVTNHKKLYICASNFKYVKILYCIFSHNVN